MNNIRKFLMLSSMALGVMANISSVLAIPVIGISSMYDVLLPEVKSTAKRVYNTGDATAFVRVELLEVHPIHPGDEVPQQALSNHQLERNQLIVTPQRLIIPPENFQTIRILWPGERSKERYFRVRFVPVIPDESFGLDDDAVSQYRQSALRVGLNVLTGYGTVVIIQPDKPIFKTILNENAAASTITIKNQGNSTVSLDDIRQCKAAKTDCSAATSQFVLPGKSHVLAKKAGYETHFSLIEGKKTQVLSY